MNDFISLIDVKRAVKRCINDNKYNKEKLDVCLAILNWICDIARIIPVDAEIVVRCKDCKHKEEISGSTLLCGIHECYMDEDDFCSYGERKVDEK